MLAKYKIIAVLMGCLFVGGLARADFNPKKWQYYSEILPDSGGKYAQIILTRDVYCQSNNNLADLRIIQGGREIPYKRLEDGRSEESLGLSAAMLDKSVVPGQYNSFVLDLGKPGIVNNRLEIQTSSTNFTRKVDISGGNDGVHWAILRDDGYIFDFTRDYHSQSLNVRYPNSIFRFIRVRIWNYDQKPLGLKGAYVFQEVIHPATEMLVFRGKGSISQNADEKSTDVVLDFGCHGLQGHRMVITSPDTDYSRLVEIAGSDDLKIWTEIGRGRILKYDTPRFKGEESSIVYYGTAYRYMRARIRNYDDQPIRISKVAVYGLRNSLFFPYQAGKDYRLYYGNAEAQPPIYDIEQTFKYLSSQSAVMLKLGASMKNPDFVMPIATRPWLEKNPWILWAVLIAAVILLGWLTVKSIIQTKATPPGAE